MVAIMIPLTSEKVQGVLDDATFTATLCMARDGKHYFFSAIVVDGGEVGVPNKRWPSRKAAMLALADIASAHQKKMVHVETPLPPVNDEESPIETPVDALMGEPTDVIMDPNLEFAELIRGSAIDLAGDIKPRDSSDQPH